MWELPVKLRRQEAGPFIFVNICSSPGDNLINTVEGWRPPSEKSFQLQQMAQLNMSEEWSLVQAGEAWHLVWGVSSPQPAGWESSWGQRRGGSGYTD